MRLPLAYLEKRRYVWFNKATKKKLQCNTIPPLPPATPGRCSRSSSAGHGSLRPRTAVLAGCCGFYNAALEARIGAWMKAGVSISYYDQCKSLTAIRNNTQFPELAALSVQVFRGVLQRLDRSFRDFFRRTEGGGKPGFPRFKAARRWRTVEIAEVSRGMVRRPDRDWRLHVKGLPPLQLRTSRELPEGTELKTLRVVRKPLRTEVHLGFAFPPVAPKEAIARPVGIDAGVANRLTLSDGGEVAKREVDRGPLRRLQRAVARATPGSGNRRKKAGSLARKWKRIADANRQTLHRTVSALSRAYDFFAIEDLQIANMMRSAKGTAAEPGRNVRAKAGLNRAISEQGWGMFFTLVRDKAASAGLQVAEVAPRGTSQSCSGCGAVAPKCLAVRVHACPACGLVLDRDVNAARNILQRALARSGAGSGGMFPLPVATAGAGDRGSAGTSGAVAPLVAEQCHV